jgi:Dolichyl-phosphate-mannose-protein mannosyltransferase
VEQSETKAETSGTFRPQARRASWWLLSLYSIFLLATTSRIATRRHLWFDEIDTFFLARLPSLRAIWDALLLGTDGQPLGFYIPVHLSHLFFGASELSTRLCAVIPFWATTLVLYYAVSRRTSSLYGFIAALTLPCTVAFQYSFEARPYALVLLFSACSFVSWQTAKEQRCRILSVPMLAITLAAAISVHYNAVLLVIPILIGELAYFARSRKIDWGVLLAICASGLPLIVLLPHIRAIHVYSQSYWSVINFSTVSEIYVTLCSRFIVLTIVGCALFGLWASLSRKRLSGIRAEFGGLPLHELAAACGYMLLPLACFILSVYTRALHYRYVIGTVIGISLFVAFMLWIFRSILSGAAVVLCALLALNLLERPLSRLRTPDEDKWGAFASYSELLNPETRFINQSQQAVVMGDGPFLVIAKYGSPNLRERSFYVFRKAHRTLSELVFRGLRNAVRGPLNLVEVSEFKRAHRSFLMYDPEPWLLDQLLAEGNQVAIVANWPHKPLYEVTVRQ